MFAKNEEENNTIQAFVIENPSEGLQIKSINHKFSLRCATNGNISLKNVFVPEENRLEYGTDFMGTIIVLMKARLGVAWMAAAASVGAYEECLKYCMKRH